MPQQPPAVPADRSSIATARSLGVNFAILNAFGGSNLAVPVRYADELVK